MDVLLVLAGSALAGRGAANDSLLQATTRQSDPHSRRRGPVNDGVHRRHMSLSRGG
jgi:hypothetical protein